ncbi:fibronectin type III domain-containing protein, partial [Emergencia timonensis]
VLLALSVVFTYTVGTAFADTPDEVSAEKAKMKTAVTDYASRISYDASGKLGSAPELNPADKNLTKTAIDAVINKVISKYEGEIIKADNAGTDLAAAWADIDTDAKLAGVIFTDNATDLYTKVIADEVAALNAKLATYTVSDYPEVDQSALESAISTAKSAIETATSAAADKVALGNLASARDAFDTTVKDFKTKAAFKADLDSVKSKAKSNIASAASAFKTYAVSEYNKVIDNNASAPTAVAEAKARLNALDATIATLTEMYGAQIDAVEYDSEKAYTGVSTANKDAVDAVSTKAATTFATSALAGYEDAADALGGTTMLLEYAKATAEQKKLEYDTSTGLAKYNTASVDKALADATADIYAGTADTFVKVDAFFTAPKLQTAVAEKAALETAKTTAITAITTMGYALTEWSGDNADRAKAVQDEYTAKIKAAATAAEVTKAETAAKAALDKIVKTANVAALETLTKTQMATLGYTGAAGAVGTKAAPEGLLMQHAVSLAAKNPTAYSDTLLQNTATAAVDFLVDKVVNNIDATKKTDGSAIQTILKANYAEALAIMSGLKTDAELKTVETEVINAINALPTVVSLEDKDKYVAAQKALEAFVNTPGADIANISNSGLLEAYMTKLITLEKAAVEAKISALPKLVTVSDKEAIEAADAALKAYDDTYGKYNTAPYDYGYLAASNAPKLETAKAGLENAMLVDAAKKIAELPINITAADKAAVEAARAAYDALTDAQKEAFSESLLKKLVAAEAAFGDSEIKAVESLKIKASSKLYKGKKIRVNWRVADGDASTIDGYRVYKSTKMNSGYKFMGKTKKLYMDNKKDLKKGKRYFYKVRAYKVVDGKTYYSDYSNLANRYYK